MNTAAVIVDVVLFAMNMSEVWLRTLRVSFGFAFASLIVMPFFRRSNAQVQRSRAEATPQNRTAAVATCATTVLYFSCCVGKQNKTGGLEC